MDHTSASGMDLLLDVLLRIARRADQLTAAAPSQGMNLHCWLLAEAETLGFSAPLFRCSDAGARPPR